MAQICSQQSFFIAWGGRGSALRVIAALANDPAATLVSRQDMPKSSKLQVDEGGAGLLEPVRLGTAYHASISRPRHDPLTAILEIVDNVLGRARWDSSVRMTCSHLMMEDFKLNTDFFVALSNTKISHDDFVSCLDQRPRAETGARSHALSVFGDGMKSSHNCLVDGNGNLFLCVMHRDQPSDEPQFWIARYGKAFDDSQGSEDVLKLICEWDVDKAYVKGPKPEADVHMRALAKNSPFDAPTTKKIGANVQQMFTLLKRTAVRHGYDNVFMQVIGPMGQRCDQDGNAVSLVSRGASSDKLNVWRPTAQDKGEVVDVATTIAQSYVPPESTLASTPKPHAFSPLNNRPNPNTKLDLFVGDEARIDYQLENLWARNRSDPSETLEVICEGIKVAELQIKQLESHGSLLSLSALAPEECCGALVAMEGGRLLNRRPDAFYDDGLCTQKLLTDTPARLLNHFVGGNKLESHVGNITRGLAACADTKFLSEKQVRDMATLIHQCKLGKDAMIEAIGGRSLALVQLHVTVVTDPSKTQLDVQRWTSVQLRGQDVVIGPYKLLGAIFRTIVQHTFSTKLEELRAMRLKPPAWRQTPRVAAANGEASSSSQQLAAAEGEGDGEGDGPRSATGRKRGQLTVAKSDDEASTPSKRPKAMSKVAVAKSHASWIDKYEAGKCSPEHCIAKLKALMSKYHALD